MILGLTKEQTIARAVSDFRMGRPVHVPSDTSGFATPIETLDAPTFQSIKGSAKTLTLVLTDHRAQTLKIPAYDQNLVRVRLDATVTLSWLYDVVDPSRDLSHPLKGPFQTDRDGSAEMHRAGIALCKLAHLLPAVLVFTFDPVLNDTHAQQKDLTTILPDWVLNRPPDSPLLTDVASAPVPLAASKFSRVHVYRPDDGGEEHYAIEIGKPDRSKPVLTRLHSACFTGDVLGSLKCDCGPQLHAALQHMGSEGAGVLLYLNQEGRGIGLANKMRAYSLQNEGFDTVEANHRLGFEDDERDFRLGSKILKKLGINAVRLMTNNPAKIARMEDMGISVAERVPLKVGENALNHHYLLTKAKKSGHLL
jgi:GTP cyclohydrolase II